MHLYVAKNKTFRNNGFINEMIYWWERCKNNAYQIMNKALAKTKQIDNKCFIVKSYYKVDQSYQRQTDQANSQTVHCHTAK